MKIKKQQYVLLWKNNFSNSFTYDPDCLVRVVPRSILSLIPLCSKFEIQNLSLNKRAKIAPILFTSYDTDSNLTYILLRWIFLVFYQDLVIRLMASRMSTRPWFGVLLPQVTLFLLGLAIVKMNTLNKFRKD